MSNEHINFIRDVIKDVPQAERQGYSRALADIIRVSEEVPIFGHYVDSEVRDLAHKLAKAKNVAVRV